MNIFLRTFIISMVVYIAHIIMLFFLSFFYEEEKGYISYGLFASAVYIFVVAFWAYYILTFTYCILTRNLKTIAKLMVALAIMFTGYLLSRAGDIIDGDFMEKFRLDILLYFLFSAIIILAVDSRISRRKAA
jgi:hypothetical protein